MSARKTDNLWVYAFAAGDEYYPGCMNLRRLLVFVCLFGVLTAGLAQTGTRFNADTYYGQCLRFEAGGDLETARQSCLNALELNPNSRDAELALARIDTSLGNFGEAETRLRGLEGEVGGAEPALLLARIALEEGRLGEAEGFLRRAESRGRERPNSELEGRRNFLSGTLAERRGDSARALEHYQAAIAADGLERAYRLADASLRFQQRSPEGAQEVLESYRALTGDNDPELLALLGRIVWVAGESERAASLLEAAVVARGSNASEALGRDLRDLALIYYSQGEFESGSLALRSALRRGDLLNYFIAWGLPWLLALVALLALHLVGESRIDTHTSLELVEGPEAWTVDHVYVGLLGSLLVAGLCTLLYGFVLYENPLAFLTLLLSADAYALFVAVLALCVTLYALWRVQANDFPPLETLLGSGGTPLGIGVGIGLVVLVVAVLTYAPGWNWLRGFPFELTRLTPLLAVAVVLLPLSELFFRAFAVPPLSRRYTPLFGVLLSSLLYALVLGAPLVLFFAIGLAVGEAFRRSRSGLTPLVAQLVLYV